MTPPINKLDLRVFNDKMFTLNGFPYPKKYELIKSAGNKVSLVSIFDKNDTVFSNESIDTIMIDGNGFQSVSDLIRNFEPFLPNFNTPSGGGYSIDETLTGEKWINGKPIYRKVISSISTTDYTPHVIAENVEEFISVDGFVKVVNQYGSIFYAKINSEGANGIYQTENYKFKTEIIIDQFGTILFLFYYNNNLQQYHFRLIAEYTKTTD